eukprot:gene6025-6635_t
MLVKIVNQTTQELEWGMIEFQGDLVGQLEGQVLGQAEIRADGKVEMELGQQLLEGSVITLKNPFLVVASPSQQPLEEPQPTEEDSDLNESRQSPQSLAILGVIKKKIIFNSRPKPISLKRPRS